MAIDHEINHEMMHPIGSDPAWSESYYFNFVDPDSKLAMFTRMGFRPGNGWADALHVVYLGGDRVAFTYGRREIDKNLSLYDGDLKVGELEIVCDDTFKRWTINYKGAAQDIADAEILLERRKLRPDNWFSPAQLDMSLSFECLTEARYANKGEHGHFEQSGRVSGQIKLDDQSWEVKGYGVRDKSWGPRDWGASDRNDEQAKEPLKEKPSDKLAQDPATPAPFVNWFSMNFGPDIAMGGSCFRGKDGVMRGQGWYMEDGKAMNLENIIIESEYRKGSIWHTAITLSAETERGKAVNITGKVLTVCPTKIAMPNGATFINEGLAEFSYDGRTGYGIAEHWHALKTS